MFMKRTNEVCCQNATRDIILALINLAKTNDPFLYYTPSSILRKIPKGQNAY